jgi:NAD(P)-dependent dehydrogenase (short-subunit alcohol dehydrogenase family)
VRKAFFSLQPTSKIWINRDASIPSIICLATGHDVKQVVITGVSTGIGYACVKLLLSREFRVYGSVRNQTDADRLQRDFGESFVPLLFDVTNEKTVQAEAAKVNEHLGTDTLDGLVNNAGIEVAGPLAHLPTDQFQHQLEVNLVGPFIVTKAFLPLLGSDPARKGIPGRIVNISSAGGKIAGPFTGAYSASKFGQEGFSESLRRELMLFGINGIIIGPGAVVTPIWQTVALLALMVRFCGGFHPAYVRRHIVLIVFGLLRFRGRRSPCRDALTGRVRTGRMIVAVTRRNSRTKTKLSAELLQNRPSF